MKKNYYLQPWVYNYVIAVTAGMKYREQWINRMPGQVSERYAMLNRAVNQGLYAVCNRVEAPYILDSIINRKGYMGYEGFPGAPSCFKSLKRKTMYEIALRLKLIPIETSYYLRRIKKEGTHY